MGIADTYADEIHDQYRRYAVWPPHEPVRLGDVGEVRGHVFTRTGSLQCKVTARPSAAAIPLVYTSKGVAKVCMSASGEAAPGVAPAPIARAALKIDFTREHAVCVRLAGYRVEAIENLDAVERTVIALREAGKWSDRQVVVTALHIAEDATVLVSNASGASVDLDAEGTGDLADLGNGSLRLALRSAAQMGVQIVGARSLTPFCGLAAVRGFFRPALRPRSFAPDADDDPEEGGAEPYRLVDIDAP